MSGKGAGRIAVYSRKSRFTGKGESVGNQVELCKAYILAHYGEDMLKEMVVYEDEGFSGGNLNRPAFRRMMAAAERGELRAVIVYRLDRISRNIGDFSHLIETLSRAEVAFISIREQFDTATPMGRAMMYIASVFSQLERETIAERIRDNMRELAKTGRWLGGTTPTGYASEAVRRVTVDGKARKACRLKLIPEEGEIVRMIFALYRELGALTSVEAELMRRGLKTKNGKYFTRFSIKAILQNPVYMIADREAYAYLTEVGAGLFSGAEDFDDVHGIMAYHRTDQEKGRATVCCPASEWIVAVGKHQGLIPGREWAEVQEILEQSGTGAYRRPQKNTALLTGLLFCSCGSRMYPKLSSRKNTEGEQGYTYVCKMKERSRRSLCGKENACGKKLDQVVLEQLADIPVSREAFVRQLTEDSRRCSRPGADEVRLHALQREHGAIEKKIRGLTDALAGLQEAAARDQVAGRIGQLFRDKEDLEERIQLQERAGRQRAMDEQEIAAMSRMLGDFAACICAASVEQKRTAVRRLVEKVVWDGTSAHIFLRGGSGAGEWNEEKTHSGEDSK